MLGRSVVQRDPGEVCQSLLLPVPEDCPAAATLAKAGLPVQTSKVRRSKERQGLAIRIHGREFSREHEEHGSSCSAPVVQHSCPTDLLAVLCT